MQIYQIPEIEGYKIDVTTSSSSLFDLINAQLSTPASFPSDLNALDIYVTDGDVKISWGAEDPSTAEGFTLKQGVLYSFRGRAIGNLQLISVSGTVACEVTVGYAGEDESESFSVVESTGGSESGEVAGTELTVTGGLAADPTSLPSAVDAGDAVQSTHSLQGEVLSYLSRYISGEDSGRDVMKVQNQNQYEYIDTNTTTTVKSGAGHLKAITIGTKGASSNTMTVYDNTAGSGDIIAVIDTTSAEATLHFDCEFTDGLTIVTATGTAAKATIIYS